MLGELTVEQIEDVLRQETVGRIGCHAGGRTYVVPITQAGSPELETPGSPTEVG